MVVARRSTVALLRPLKVSTLLEQAGAHVPHVHASDLRRGFVVMEDLGNSQYLSLLRTGRGVDNLYGDALTTLANIQVRGLRAAEQLAPYDREPLERELLLMPEWFLRKHLGLDLTPEERALITVTFEFLINEALLQPQVFVHRDYHSRNLMVLPAASMEKGGPGVIDFQDALRGPIGYDLVSLLKDCYISWSRERVERWVKGYRRVLGNLGANVGDSEYQFVRSLFYREVLENRMTEPEEVLEGIEAVTAADIQRLAGEVIRDDALNFGLVGPFDDDQRFLDLMHV